MRFDLAGTARTCGSSRFKLVARFVHTCLISVNSIPAPGRSLTAHSYAPSQPGAHSAALGCLKSATHIRPNRANFRPWPTRWHLRLSNQKGNPKPAQRQADDTVGDSGVSILGGEFSASSVRSMIAAWATGDAMRKILLTALVFARKRDHWMASCQPHPAPANREHRAAKNDEGPPLLHEALRQIEVRPLHPYLPIDYRGWRNFSFWIQMKTFRGVRPLSRAY